MSEIKDTLRQLFLSTLEGLSLNRVMPEKLACRDDVLEVGGDRIELGRYKKIIVVAIGKAAFQMSRSLTEIVRGRALAGIVVARAAFALEPKRDSPVSSEGFDA